MVKFAHLADVHLGAFREAELRAFNLKAFEIAVDESLRANVDFIVIAGDLFHTSLPEMSIVDAAVKKLKEARDAGKRVYVVFGSHDYSPTETSIINVLESAGVIRKIAAGEYGEDGRLRLQAFKDEETGCTLVG
ncbi:MAG: metallophosphoesterase, partial [Candidatus Micrarchaeota archaeon]